MIAISSVRRDFPFTAVWAASVVGGVLIPIDMLFAILVPCGEQAPPGSGEAGNKADTELGAAGIFVPEAALGRAGPFLLLPAAL